ncbi:MAG: hypothetical protein ABJC05_09840 [Pyrinomonadaceae bacterium]
MALIANGGNLGPYLGANQGRSARARGVRQGSALFILGILIVPILAVLYNTAGGSFLELMLPLSAIICFVGGLMRMLYAAVFEEGRPSVRLMPTAYAPPLMGMPAAAQALPPATANPGPVWRPRTSTAELVHPPSVTENTTRLLDKDDSNQR